MFGNSPSKNTNAAKNVKKAPIAGPSSLSINSLVEGTRIEGKIHARNDIRIDGEIVGSLSCDGKVIIGPTGYVQGDIHCTNAIIEGKFEGILEVKESLDVKEKAVINGEINTGKLNVQNGAVFNVSCKMGGQKIKNFGSDKVQEKTSDQKQKEVLSFVND